MGAAACAASIAKPALRGLPDPEIVEIGMRVRFSVYPGASHAGEKAADPIKGPVLRASGPVRYPSICGRTDVSLVGPGADYLHPSRQAPPAAFRNTASPIRAKRISIRQAHLFALDEAAAKFLTEVERATRGLPKGIKPMLE
jgi:hypothetical protein